MADVCGLHKLGQGMSKGCFPSPLNWPDHGPHCRMRTPEFSRCLHGLPQIPLVEADQPATTFITPSKYFCYVKMSFRLKNAGATYQWFLGWASKIRLMVCEWFDLKTTQTVFSSLASKSKATIFSSFASKLAAPVCWFGSQNYRDGFIIWASKLSRFRFVGCATKPTDGERCWTRVKIWRLALPESKSRRVSQSGLKTGGGATAGGACDIITEVTSGLS
jgi:hypothetical protein